MLLKLYSKMMIKYVIACIVLTVACIISQTLWNLRDDRQFYTVETSSGRIRGVLNHSLFDGKSYVSFRGIPFAKPPINQLRFKV